MVERESGVWIEDSRRGLGTRWYWMGLAQRGKPTREMKERGTRPALGMARVKKQSVCLTGGREVEGAEVGYGRVGYGMGIGSQAGQQAVKSPGHRVSSASSRGTPHSSYGLCARESCQTNNSQGWSAAFRLVQSSTGAALSRRHRRSDLFSFRLWIPVCDDARRASAVRTAT